MKLTISEANKKQFISIFQMLKNVSNMIQMNMNEDKIHIQGMDNSHVSLYDIQLDKTWFHNYEIDVSKDVCVDSALFSQILSLGLETEQINLIFHEETVEMQLIGKDYNKIFNIHLIENNYEWMSIPNSNDYDADFSIKTKLIQEYCGQLLLFGDTLNVNCNDTNVYFFTSGNNGDMKIEIKIDDLMEYSITEETNIKIQYSLNFIQKTLLTYKFFENVHFFISTNLPLKISYNLSCELSSCVFYIAPKIDDDDI